MLTIFVCLQSLASLPFLDFVLFIIEQCPLQKLCFRISVFLFVCGKVLLHSFCGLCLFVKINFQILYNRAKTMPRYCGSKKLMCSTRENKELVSRASYVIMQTVLTENAYKMTHNKHLLNTIYACILASLAINLRWKLKTCCKIIINTLLERSQSAE